MNNTTELTKVGRRTAGPQRAGFAAVIVTLLVALAVAIAVFELRSTASPAPTATSPLSVSVAPGHTQPATLIHRISAQPTQQADRNR